MNTPAKESSSTSRISLAEANRWLMESLDVVTSACQSLHSEALTNSDIALIEAVKAALMRIANFKAIGFAWFTEDGADCILEYVHPESERDTLQREFEQQVENGFFGWALHQARPVVAHSAIDTTRIVMSALATREQIAGMFIGLTDDPFVPDASLKLILILLMVFQNTRENRKLYETLDRRNRDLEDTVKERTRELVDANDELAWAVREAKRLADEAFAANSAKSMFLATMSHEIRTPMNGIVGMAELLLETSLNETQRDYLQSIMRSSEALVAIINDILDFSRIEAGKLPIEAAPFNLENAVRDVVHLLSVTAQEKGLELGCRYDPSVPEILIGDIGRIRQILTNIIGNAIKFTSAGHVRIDVDAQNLAEDIKQIRFIITDTGIGIDAAKINDIFDSFTQADGSISRRFGGTGLGLAISRRLVEMMQGQITVASEPGKGTTFTVEIPLKPGAPSAPLNPATLPWNGRHALLVENSPFRTQVMGQVLTSFGLQIAAYPALEPAIAALQQAHAAELPIWAVLIRDHVYTASEIQTIDALHEIASLTNTRLAVLSQVRWDQQRLSRFDFTACLRCPPTPTEVLDALKPIWQLDHPTENTEFSAIPTISMTAPIPASPLTQAQQKPVLLVAEDNPINQRVALDTLTKLGYEVDIAANGREALDMSAKRTYALLFMDMQMPEMDGLTATEAIRERERVQNAPHRLPIVAMTANAMQSDRERCLKAGMDDYIAKPFRRATVEKILKIYLGDAIPTPLAPTAATNIHLYFEHSHDIQNQIATLFQQRIPNLQLNTADNWEDLCVKLGAIPPVLVILDCSTTDERFLRLHAAIEQAAPFENTRIALYSTPNQTPGPPLTKVRILPELTDPDRFMQFIQTAWQAPSTDAAQPQAPLSQPQSPPETAAFAQPSNEQPPINLTIALEMVDGDRELLKTLADMALELIPNELQELKTALSINDEKAAILHAHTLKGQSAQFGAEPLRAIAYQAEMAGKSGNLPKIIALLPQIEHHIAEFCNAIRKELSCESA